MEMRREMEVEMEMKGDVEIEVKVRGAAGAILRHGSSKLRASPLALS